MTSLKQPWWLSDNYHDDRAVPAAFEQSAGPKGVALVKAFDDGRTTQGWGLNPPPGSTEGFMPRYLKGEFLPNKSLFGYNKGRHAFAFVMRAVRLVCIDIDGKNGGIEHASRLGALPQTLSETSKSGDGYHLFYLVDEEWDDEKGFGLLSDRIGIEQGVDFRATGCVYHYSSQRWNNRLPALLPQHLLELLRHRDQRVAAANARITSVLATNDDMEVLIMHDELTLELAKPIPSGKRNNTLFAIGSQMKAAQVPGWDDKLRVRAEEVGLLDDEIEKLVGNVDRYA